MNAPLFNKPFKGIRKPCFIEVWLLLSFMGGVESAHVIHGIFFG
jgi:hypothetical protein